MLSVFASSNSIDPLNSLTAIATYLQNILQMNVTHLLRNRAKILTQVRWAQFQVDELVR